MRPENAVIEYRDSASRLPPEPLLFFFTCQRTGSSIAHNRQNVDNGPHYLPKVVIPGRAWPEPGIIAWAFHCCRMSKPGYVYIVASMTRGFLYTGVTSNLVRRAWQHRNGSLGGFSRKYGTKRLVYYEIFEEIGDAIAREKALKKWRRQWKIELIETANPEWDDLYFQIAP